MSSQNKDTNKGSLGEQICKARESAGLSQEALAQLRADPSRQQSQFTTPVKSNGPLTQEARDAIGAFETLHSVCSVGITYRDYPAKLADCRVVVDRFLHRYKAHDRLRGQIENTMDLYVDVLDFWRRKYNVPTPPGTVVENRDPILNRLWTRYPGLQDELYRQGCKDPNGYYIEKSLSLMWARAGRQGKALRDLL